MLICQDCMHICKGKCDGEECVNFTQKVTPEELRELRYEVSRQNVDLHRLCKYCGINYKKLKRMLNSKEPFTYKYLYILNSRLNEKDWIIYHIEEHGMGENMDNHFDDKVV